MEYRYLGIFIPVFAVAACQSTSTIDTADLSTFGDSAASVDDTSKVAYYPSDEMVKMGKVQFREKNYGSAYKAFKSAVARYPNDPQALLGFAASSDMLGRFKDSDAAYRKLGSMIPDRPEYLNNVGYSYLLRGELPQARRYFLRAYEIDPSNDVTANNLELLRNSTQFAKRG